MTMYTLNSIGAAHLHIDQPNVGTIQTLCMSISLIDFQSSFNELQLLSATPTRHCFNSIPSASHLIRSHPISSDPGVKPVIYLFIYLLASQFDIRKEFNHLIIHVIV